MDWICKCCGTEITILAKVQGLYDVFLDKNKKIIDYDDYRELDLPNAKITTIVCENCGDIGDLDGIAYWEED